MSSTKQITLTPFQQEKLEYFFKFFEPNADNELVEDSLAKFVKRILEYTGWDTKSHSAQECYEVFETFFEILFDRTAKEDASNHKVTVSDWWAFWSHLLPGCMGMYNFPIWLRLLPKTLFKIIDRDEDGLITEQELYQFYKDMVQLEAEEARENSHLAFSQMTDDGRYPLNLSGYDQIFANFLIGRTPYGPGRHIFGCFEHSVDNGPFHLIMPAPEDEEESESTIKIHKEKRPKRGSLPAK
ncbi:uncharacterized protein LOC112571657 [Pomacea canaliculata]|uniref:uncharacterized protein LOC112571657 n=1 Tax=Pomacea canaliculata TaxID=400727 RepID=UPI000D734165|nr:uncharacterized protein LOC112571657 [Pomacea canaliculata]